MSDPASREQANHALMIAVQTGNVTAVKAALRGGANVNYRNKSGNVVDMTPLCRAACFGHTEVIKVLLAAGARVNQAGLFRRTPMHEAAYGGHTPVAEALKEAGARLDVRDDDGCTPQELAAVRGHKAVSDTLQKWSEGQRLSKYKKDAAGRIR